MGILKKALEEFIANIPGDKLEDFASSSDKLWTGRNFVLEKAPADNVGEEFVLSIYISKDTGISTARKYKGKGVTQIIIKNGEFWTPAQLKDKLRDEMTI